MKLFSLNYVREGIILSVVIIFSGILFWNVMRQSRLEGLSAEVKASNTAMNTYKAIETAKNSIKKAEKDKIDARTKLDNTKPTEKADAQSTYDLTIAELDSVIDKAKKDISKAESTNTVATNSVKNGM